MTDFSESHQPPGLGRRLIWLVPLILVLGLGGLFYRQLGHDPAIVPQATTGKPLPAFTLPSLSDNAVRTQADLPKEPYLLNVWGSWCPTCALEHPQLVKLAQNGVTLVGVNYKDDPEEALSYLATKGNPFVLNLQDSEGNFGLDLGLTGAPETFVIDRQQHIRLHLVGEVNQDVWQTRLQPCLTDLKAAKEPARCR